MMKTSTILHVVWISMESWKEIKWFSHIYFSIIYIDTPHLTLYLKIHITVFYMYKWYCTKVCVLNSINVYLVRKPRLSEREKCIEDDMVNKIRKLLIVDIFVDVSVLFSNRQSKGHEIHIITWRCVTVFVWKEDSWRTILISIVFPICDIIFLNPRFGWTVFF